MGNLWNEKTPRTHRNIENNQKTLTNLLNTNFTTHTANTTDIHLMCIERIQSFHFPHTFSADQNHVSNCMI